MWLNFILLLFLCVLLLSKYGRLRASANKDTNDIYQEFIGFSGFSKAFILQVQSLFDVKIDEILRKSLVLKRGLKFTGFLIKW